MKNYTFTVIVPVYNEQDNLIRVEKELVSYIKIASKPTKILFVNDGSNDNSQVLIEAICDRNEDFTFISFKENRGLSAALKAGFDHVNTKLLGYIDSDLQTSPSDFNLLLEHIDAYDLVTGIRVHRKDTIIKKVSSTLANRFRWLFTQDKVIDSGCPLKVIKTSYAKRMPMFKGLHRYLPAMILLQKGKIKQVPVQHFPRIAGKAKYGFWNRVLSPFTNNIAYLSVKKRHFNYTIDAKSK